MSAKNKFSPEKFFNIDGTLAAGLFDDLTYVWEGVAALPQYIEKTIKPGVQGDVEDGAWLEPGCVQLGEGSRVEHGAIVRGPTIIGRNTVVRSNAYIRGHVLVGDECLIGHAVEVRQLLLLNNSAIPHTNCFFTSLLGNRVKIGGQTNTGNRLLTGKEIMIRIDQDGERQSFPTGQDLFGTVIGDNSIVGGMTLLHPGTIIGQDCLIYPQCSVSGYIHHNSTQKTSP